MPHLVGAVASDWGWHSAEDGSAVSGKVAWAELGGAQESSEWTLE